MTGTFACTLYPDTPAPLLSRDTSRTSPASRLIRTRPSDHQQPRTCHQPWVGTTTITDGRVWALLRGIHGRRAFLENVSPDAFDRVGRRRDETAVVEAFLFFGELVGQNDKLG